MISEVGLHDRLSRAATIAWLAAVVWLGAVVAIGVARSQSSDFSCPVQPELLSDTDFAARWTWLPTGTECDFRAFGREVEPPPWSYTAVTVVAVVVPVVGIGLLARRLGS